MAEADSAYGSGDDEKDFITFYKQTLNINENDESKFDLEIGGPDFPRLLHNDMDEFQYYDVEKFNKLYYPFSPPPTHNWNKPWLVSSLFDVSNNVCI